MPLLVHTVLRTLGVHGLAVEHARLADRKVEDIDHLLDLAVTFGLDLAVFQRHEAAERILVFAKRVADSSRGFAANGRGNGAPFPESVPGRIDETVVFRPRRRTNTGDQLAVCRVN